jgi:hypothetical protein
MPASKVNVLIGADTRGLRKGLHSAQMELRRSARTMNNISGSILRNIALPFAAGSAGAIKMASDFEESMNKVDVAFKTSSGSVQQFAKTTLKQFGIAEGTALDMAATFGDMGTSMGLTTAASADMSKSLVGLAGDLASFKNIQIDVANTALTSIFTGETESLKKLGIVMTEVNLQEFARSKGIDKSIKKMTQAEKVQLRYQYVMEQSANAQGDFARTGGGAANQMRILQESLKELGVGFGQIILPAFTKGVKKLNSLVERLRGMSTETKTTIFRVGAFTTILGGALRVTGLLMDSLSSTIGGLKAFSRWLTTSTKAQNALNLAMKRSTLGLVAVAVMGAVAAYKHFNKELDVMGKLQDDVNKDFAVARGEMQLLFDAVKNETLAMGERQEALDKLQSIYPEHLKNLDLEKSTIEEIAIAEDNAAKALKERIEQKIAQAALEELLIKQQQKRAQIAEAEASRFKIGTSNLTILNDELNDIDSAIAKVTEGLGNVFKITGTGSAEGPTIKPKQDTDKPTDDTKGQPNPKIQEIRDLAEVYNLWAEAGQAVADSGIRISHGLGVIGANIDEVVPKIEVMKAEYSNMSNVLEFMGETMLENIAPAVRSFGNTFAETLNEGKGALNAFAYAVVSAAKKIVGALIREGVITVITGTLKQNKALGPFAVPIAAAAGVAAETMITSALNNIKLPKFAEGGIVSGRSVVEVGEYSGVKNNPEIIAPLNKLQGMMKPQNIIVDVRGKIEGRDIVLVMDRYRVSNSRFI